MFYYYTALNYGAYILIGLFVYLVSSLAMCRWMQRAYSKGGVYQSLNASKEALVYCFLPAFNTVWAMLNLFDSPIRKKEKETAAAKRYNNFLDVKK